MKLTNLRAFNFEGAIRGMRNPMNSWDRSDSYFFYNTMLLGPKDIQLAQKLIKAGGEHRKFLRQILTSFDLTAPLYFWKEFDTYKIGTVANSTSTMHKLASTPITLECFETDDFDEEWLKIILFIFLKSYEKNISKQKIYDTGKNLYVGCQNLGFKHVQLQ